MRIELPLEAAAADGYVRLPFRHPAFLTLATAGDMRERAARESMLASIGIEPSRLFRCRQVHSRIVHAVEDLEAQADESTNSLPEGDGLVSGPGGPWLAVGVGDCMPLLLSDQRTGAYGVLHSGWRGTGILEPAVGAMRERYGSDPADVMMLMGPCISAEAYVVDEARGRQFSVWGREAVVHRGDRTYLDMRAANRGIAERLGIGSVAVINHCTYKTPQLGSFRREGTEGYTGMLAIIGPSHEVKEDDEGLQNDLDRRRS